MPLPISRSGVGLHDRSPVFVFPIRDGGRVVGFAPAGGYGCGAHAPRGAHAPGRLAAQACVPSALRPSLRDGWRLATSASKVRAINDARLSRTNEITRTHGAVVAPSPEFPAHVADELVKARVEPGFQRLSKRHQLEVGVVPDSYTPLAEAQRVRGTLGDRVAALRKHVAQLRSAPDGRQGHPGARQLLGDAGVAR